MELCDITSHLIPSVLYLSTLPFFFPSVCETGDRQLCVRYRAFSYFSKNHSSTTFSRNPHLHRPSILENIWVCTHPPIHPSWWRDSFHDIILSWFNAETERGRHSLTLIGCPWLLLWRVLPCSITGKLRGLLGRQPPGNIHIRNHTHRDRRIRSGLISRFVKCFFFCHIS